MRAPGARLRPVPLPAHESQASQKLQIVDGAILVNGSTYLMQCMQLQTQLRYECRRDGGNVDALQLASAGRDWQHATDDEMGMSSL